MSFSKAILFPRLLLLLLVALQGFTAAAQPAVPADFDGNGVRDLVWQNNSTRQVLLWYMGVGGTYLGANYLDPNGQPGWSVAAVADIPGDRNPDLVSHQIVGQNDSTRQVY